VVEDDLLLVGVNSGFAASLLLAYWESVFLSLLCFSWCAFRDAVRAGDLNGRRTDDDDCNVQQGGGNDEDDGAEGVEGLESCSCLISC